MNLKNKSEIALLQRALEGDEEATKIYCGSYHLVMISSSSGMYRAKEIIFPMIEIKSYMGVDVYDKDGFLKSVFWSLPRI